MALTTKNTHPSRSETFVPKRTIADSIIFLSDLRRYANSPNCFAITGSLARFLRAHNFETVSEFKLPDIHDIDVVFLDSSDPLSSLATEALQRIGNELQCVGPSFHVPIEDTELFALMYQPCHVTIGSIQCEVLVTTAALELFVTAFNVTDDPIRQQRKVVILINELQGDISISTRIQLAYRKAVENSV